MNSTDQQRAIANCNLSGVTRVVARAGTGKTKSLCDLSMQQATRGMKGLYLAYNKSAEMDASKRFPKSFVTARTVNGLAYRVCGVRYSHKLRAIKSVEVIKLMGLAWDWKFAKLVLGTLTAWCASDLFEFPTSAISIEGIPVDTPTRLAYSAQVARQLWERMIDVRDEAPMSHDGYLKLYQLSCPKISQDYLMVDEGQDTNPVTWDIIKRQTCPVIIVGDPYQSIYQFRGAVNALELSNAAQEFQLTQSFRFGAEVARIVNALLWGFYGETTELEGLGADTTVSRFSNAIPHAVIARTNSTIFTHAVMAMQAGRKIGFVGGVSGYGFQKIVDTWYLACGNNDLVRDPFLKDFDSFQSLASYAENSGDFEVKRLVDVIKQHGPDVLTIVTAIHAAAIPSLDKADIILSSAHKVKGLTLPAVKIADDFPDLVNSEGQPIGPEKLNRQENNLLYVAYTRASHKLQVNSSMITFLHSMGMDCERYTRVEEGYTKDEPAVVKTQTAPAPPPPSTAKQQIALF